MQLVAHGTAYSRLTRQLTLLISQTTFEQQKQLGDQLRL
jgi:hypothetical protein